MRPSSFDRDEGGPEALTLGRGFSRRRCHKVAMDAARSVMEAAVPANETRHRHSENSCLWRVNPWPVSRRGGPLEKLESAAKTLGRKEAGLLLLSPYCLPMASVFCCYKHDQK